MSPTSRPTVRFSPVGGNLKENMNIIHNFDQYRKRTKLSKENSWSLAKPIKNHPTNRILVLIQYSANTSVEYIFKMKKHWKRKRSSHQDSQPTSLPLPWEGLSTQRDLQHQENPFRSRRLPLGRQKLRSWKNWWVNQLFHCSCPSQTALHV